MWPVAALTVSPAGKPSTLNSIGRWPVAGMLYSRGEPGLAPKTVGPLIRGWAGDGGVRISGISAAQMIVPQHKAATSPAPQEVTRASFMRISPWMLWK